MKGADDLGDVVSIYDGDTRLLLSILLCYV
jgi:hypothetical protein